MKDINKDDLHKSVFNDSQRAVWSETKLFSEKYAHRCSVYAILYVMGV